MVSSLVGLCFWGYLSLALSRKGAELGVPGVGGWWTPCSRVCTVELGCRCGLVRRSCAPHTPHSGCLPRIDLFICVSSWGAAT